MEHTRYLPHRRGFRHVIAHPKILLVLLGMLAALFVLYMEARAAVPSYIGVKACSKCHKKKKEGEQLGIWKKSEHAKAYRTLAGEKAKKQAAQLGVAGDPQQAAACLVCHTTAFGAPANRLKKRFKMEDGVQCETCHGAGSKYKKKKTMKLISKERGPDKKGDSPTAGKTGLVIPDENTCKTCHAKETKRNGQVFKNPSYKAFDFKEMYEKIKHEKPR